MAATFGVGQSKCDITGACVCVCVCVCVSRLDCSHLSSLPPSHYPSHPLPPTTLSPSPSHPLTYTPPTFSIPPSHPLIHPSLPPSHLSLPSTLPSIFPPPLISSYPPFFTPPIFPPSNTHLHFYLVIKWLDFIVIATALMLCAIQTCVVTWNVWSHGMQM